MAEIVRHKKTGGLYEVLFRGAQIQTNTPLSDYDEVAGYRSLENGRAWVRPTSEMDDGRFEPATPLSPAHQDQGVSEIEGLSRKATQGAAQIGRLGDKKQTHVVDFGAPPKSPFMTLKSGVPASSGFIGFSDGGVCHSDDSSSAANAAFVVALWNGYRSGRLVEDPTQSGQMQALVRAREDDQTAQFLAESAAIEREERDLAVAERAYRRTFDSYDRPDLTDLRHRVAMRAALRALHSTRDQEGVGRRPEGHGLSSSGPGPAVPAPAGASIPGAGLEPLRADEIADRIAWLFNPMPHMSGQQINVLHGGLRRSVEDLATEIASSARDQRASREDGVSQPRPEAASPIRAAEAPGGDDANSGGEAPDAGLESLADDFVLRVSEWDDRTSPDDWPEALLITRGELKCELLAFLREAKSLSPRPSKTETGA